MQPVLNKKDAKHGKQETRNRCQTRENMQPVPSARENTYQVQSEEERTNEAKRGKTRKRCQVRENMQPVLSARGNTTVAGACKFATAASCVTNGYRQDMQPVL